MQLVSRCLAQAGKDKFDCRHSEHIFLQMLLFDGLMRMPHHPSAYPTSAEAAFNFMCLANPGCSSRHHAALHASLRAS